jgi:histidinol dehydrogenase
MLGVLAQVAGCRLKVMCTPPNKNGEIDPLIVYAAMLCEIDVIYKVGGAQAIAAMAYGTQTISKVDKIFGPGNSWVTQAKYLVSGDPHGAAFDLPAGPSEVLVIADDEANPVYVAADLLSQAEHGVDSQVILICLSEAFAERVQQALQDQLATLPRQSTAAVALQHSRCFIVDDIATAMVISNAYAPEHLILQLNHAEHYVKDVEHAGSVFVGAFTPESVGDYASGTNHVLPTYGYARTYGGLSLKDFMKTMSIQSLTKEGLALLAPTVTALAEAEGLHAHARAVQYRLETSE